MGRGQDALHVGARRLRQRRHTGDVEEVAWIALPDHGLATLERLGTLHAVCNLGEEVLSHALKEG